jgi:hypothetical protein
VTARTEDPEAERLERIRREVLARLESANNAIVRLVAVGGLSWNDALVLAQVMEALRWHCDRLDRENERRAKRSPDNAKVMAESELLFPAEPNGRNRAGAFAARGASTRPSRTSGRRSRSRTR